MLEDGGHPHAHEGKPQDEFLHVRNQRNVQVSSTSPQSAMAGPSEGIQPGTERVHQTRSTQLKNPSPLMSLSTEVAASSSVVIEHPTSVRTAADEDTNEDHNETEGYLSSSVHHPTAFGTLLRDPFFGGTAVPPPNRPRATDDSRSASSETN